MCGVMVVKMVKHFPNSTLDQEIQYNKEEIYRNYAYFNIASFIDLVFANEGIIVYLKPN